MLVPQDNIKLLLGLSSEITAEEQAFLSWLHPLAEGLVKQYLKYDPEQKSHTEYLPRHLRAGGPGYDESDEGIFNITGGKVTWWSGTGETTLQLTHIPLRCVTSVFVDTSAKAGDYTGAFAADTAYTLGTDFHGEWDQPYVGNSGQLIADGAWPDTPGTVKVIYIAGYSPAELAGTATEDSISIGSSYTVAGIDASGITHAVQSTIINAFLRAQALKKKDGAGFTAGVITSENLGDYSYTIDPSALSGASGGVVTLPDDAKQALEAFRHWGLARL